MIRVRMATLAVITLFFLTLSDERGILQTASAANSVNDIRQVDFKNYAYTRPCGEKEQEIIQLHDARYTGSNGAEYILMRVAYGDLTGDGSEEAVVLLRGQNTRISRTLDEVFIYTLKNGRVVALAHFEGEKRGNYFLSVTELGSNFTIEDRLLILDQAILREGDHEPTQYYTIKYRWDGHQMVEVERSPLKSLPENMMEEG